MSHTYHLVCKDKKLHVWIGQGWNGMEVLYSGVPEKMENLKEFLNATKGHPLLFVSDNADWIYYFPEVGGGDEHLRMAETMQEPRRPLKVSPCEKRYLFWTCPSCGMENDIDYLKCGKLHDCGACKAMAYVSEHRSDSDS